jgi:hypothetical protein
MKVKFLSVLGNVCIDGHTFSNLNKRPNRLSRINEDSFSNVNRWLSENMCLKMQLSF